MRIIDSLRYQGNHVDGRLITREITETEDQIRQLLQEYFLT